MRVSPRQRELLRRQSLELPLRAITTRDAGILAEKLGYTSTPFAVLIDRGGRVYAAWTRTLPPQHLRSQIRFAKRVAGAWAGPG